MSDPLRQRYDAVPYRHGAIPETHPTRIGAIARLLGIPAALPERCRVLEIGCAEGMNLLPLAERFPAAEFLGIDFSPEQIRSAEEARVACGIANARFVCADVRAWEAEAASFDYVIAHGVYSWVPDDAKERLLAMCARALRPHGVAYLSYNTLPGWGLLDGLRRFFLPELAREQDPRAQLALAEKLIGALEQALAKEAGAYAALVREALGRMRQKPIALVFHDELATVNDPCTFTEFIRAAQSHGLRYLAEAHFATMPFDHVPAPTRAALTSLQPDLLQAQQLLDVVYERWLRNSLLCLAEPNRAGDLRVLHECAIGSRVRIESSSPGAKLRVSTAGGGLLEFDAALDQAALLELDAAASRRLPFSTLLAGVARRLEGQQVEPATFCRTLYRLFALDAVDLVLAGDGAWLREGAEPSALMRHQAARGLPLTNRWHEAVTLTGEGPRVVLEPATASTRPLLARAGLLA